MLVGRFIPTGVGNTASPTTPAPPAAVHPHGRGEHICLLFGHFRLAGSSPRAWGTRVGVVAPDRDGRFIPTGVGNTTSRMAGARLAPVHPHGRGEHGCRGTWDHNQNGSSPRAWGTPRQRPPAPVRPRFIPTGVGNTAYVQQHLDGDAVHPHGRGEHADRVRELRPRAGSSPRAWGTRTRGHGRALATRFIPTGVGNTSDSRESRLSSAVHPHGRGEHLRQSART